MPISTIASYFNEFPTVGDESVLGVEWERYNATPGNGGFGVRSDSQLAVVAEPSSTSGGNVLRITAENVAGEHYHGGVKLLRPMTYGQVELRVRVSDDASQVTSGVVIFWPTADPIRFPVGNGGEWPAGGELDFWESFNNRDTRTPAESYIHRLDPTAVPPYDAGDDETVVTFNHTGIDQSDWHKLVCTWEPDRIYMSIDNGPEITLTSDRSHIPDWDMELTLQLDAWSDTPPATPVTMDIDYVLTRDYIAPPITFPDTRLGLRCEMAFGAGNTSPLGWAWTDVSDRLWAQSMQIRRGRANESARPQPTTASSLFDSTDGALMPGNPASPFYPNVKRGTPIRYWAEGTETALILPGLAGSYCSTPADPDFDFAADFDIRMLIQPEQWAGTSDEREQIVTSKAANGGEFSWFANLEADGSPDLVYSTDGTARTQHASVPRIAALRPEWVGIAYNIGGGGKTFDYYRWPGDTTPPTDITTWEPVGSAVDLNTTPINTSTAPVEIGTFNAGQLAIGATQEGFRGRVLTIEYRDGINGSLVGAPDFRAIEPGTTTFLDPVGKLWTLHGQARVSAERIRFVGRVDDIIPSWPYGDHKAASSDASEQWTQITASGPLRRLAQGQKSLKSPLLRAIKDPPSPAIFQFAYWPCEDGTDASRFTAGRDDHGAAVISGTISTGADDSLGSSNPLPTIEAGEVGDWSGTVPTGDFIDNWAVSWLFRIPELETSPTATRLMTVESNGTVAEWRLSIGVNFVELHALDGVGGTILQAVTNGSVDDYVGPWVVGRLDTFQSGGSISYSWRFRPLSEATELTAGGSIASATLGAVTSVGGPTTGPPRGYSFGHVSVHDQFEFGDDWLDVPANGHVGETAAARFARLCTEEGIPCEVVGDSLADPLGDIALSEPMGPQQQKPLLDLLDDIVKLDMGVMMSRRTSPGLVYRTRQTIENQKVRLPLDAGQSEITTPLVPALDDQRLRNDVTVTAEVGSSAQVVDQTSIDEEGLYDEEITVAGVGGVNIRSAFDRPGLSDAVDNQNADLAAFRLALGTSGGLRFPVVSSDFVVAPQLIGPWHDVELGDRITIDNLPDQHSGDTVDLILEHIDEQMSPTSWTPKLTCSPGGPWLKSFSVSGHQILDPLGQPFTTAGINAPTGIAGSFSWSSPTQITAWAWEGYPPFDMEPDVWAGAAPAGVYPGGVVTAGEHWSQESGAFVDVPDRAYALNGTLSAAAVAAGISQPADNWRIGIVRSQCALTQNSLTVAGSDVPLDRDDTVPQYTANAVQLESLGLVAAMEDHALTGTDPTLPAALVADPSISITSLPDDTIRDTVALLDSMAANLDPSKSWIALPNEPYTTSRTTDFDDFIVTLVRRIRAAGWVGIITLPLGKWCAELPELASGAYDTLITTLAGHGVAWNLVWEWHNYGTDTSTGLMYTYADADADLAAVQAAGHAVWLAEYGQATPLGTGTAGPDAWNRNAVEIMATDVQGQALAVKYPHICPTWWASGDHTFDSSYSLTYGEDNKGNESGPDPFGAVTNPGTFPWWDVDGSPATLAWLTDGGRAHWNTAHRIAGVPVSPYPINQPWPIDTYVPPTVTTGAGGVEYQIDDPATAQADFDAALAAMNSTGGNVIRFVDGGNGTTYTGYFRVRGSIIAGGTAPNGVPGNHNVITCDPGVTVSGGTIAIDISAASHWDVKNCNIDGADLHGIRFMTNPGTVGSPTIIEGNTIVNAKHSGIKVRGWFTTPYTVCDHVIVRGNTIDGGSVVRADPEFNEGIYVGEGAGWLDFTDDVLIAQNRILNVQSDAVELKPGVGLVDGITVEDNLIGPCELVEGTLGTSIPVGHITVSYANSSQPGGDTANNIIIRRNRIYQMTQNATPIRAPIVLGRGGTECYRNIIWECESAEAVHLDSGAGGMGTGNIRVEGNTSDKTMVNNVDSYGSLVVADNIPDEAAASFVGPTTGTADQGQGTGSGFAITDLHGTGTVTYNDATDTPANVPPDPGALAVV